MAEKYEELSELVLAYKTKQLTEDQQQLLDAWVKASPENNAWLEQWDNDSWIANELEEYNEPDVEEGIKKIWAKIGQEQPSVPLQPEPIHQPRSITIYYKWAVALVLLATGAWLIYQQLPGKPLPGSTVTTTKMPVADPVNTENITLTSVGLPELIVDSLSNGLIRSQAGVTIVKQDSILLFTRVSEDRAALHTMQTIQTGKGKRLQVILPDSSAVWLNAASSIRFPLAYKNERQLAMTGEVYIEAHKNKLHPLIVTAGKMEVEVLGTKFNIKAYGVTKKVALLEGKIKVSNGRSATTLSVRGETAQVENDSTVKITRTESMDKVTAWRTGAFSFRKDPITDALGEIGRWYGVDVKYNDVPPTVISNSSFPRNIPLPAAIRLLHQVDSNLTIFKEGNVLIVSYKR